MNCSHVQNLISAFIDYELDVEEKRELRQHLVYCSECNAGYQELLEIKNCLQNLTAVSMYFDPLQDLRLRLSTEDQSLVRQAGKFFWLGRAGLIAACFTTFFLTAYLLFPTGQAGTANTLAGNTTAREPNLKTYIAPASTPRSHQVANDLDFCIDQPVNVYQASFILP